MKRTLAVAAAVAVSLVGCSTTIAGRPHAGGAQSFPSATPSPVPATTPTPKPPPGPPSVDNVKSGAELDDLISEATSSSASFRLDAAVRPAPGSSGEAVKYAVVEQLTDGDVSAAQMDVNYSGVVLTFLVLPPIAYVKLPNGVAPSSAKPWYHLSKQSKNPAVRKMAADLGENVEVSDIVGNTLDFDSPSSAASLSMVGIENVNGLSTHHFHLLMDAAEFPAGKLKEIGLKSVTEYTSDWWVDEKGHAIKSLFTLSGGGKQASATGTYSQYDATPNLHAPTAAQLGG